MLDLYNTGEWVKNVYNNKWTVGGLVALLVLIVITGWLLNAKGLSAAYSGFISVAFTIAVAFILAGILLFRAILKSEREARRVSAILLESQTRLQVLVDNIADGIITFDAQGIIDSFNPAASKMFGYHQNEVQGRAFASLLPPNAQNAILENLHGGGATTQERSANQTLEITAKRKDSSYFTAEVAVSEIISMESPMFVGIFRDVTERRRAEVQLKEKEKFTEDLIRNLAVPTFILDANHKVLIWNKACEQLTGIKTSDIEGTSDQWKAFYNHKRPVLADLMLERDADKVTTYYETYQRSKFITDGWHCENWTHHFGGETYLIFDAAPIYNTNGERVAAIESLQDITEHKLAEQSLQRFQEILDDTLDMIFMFEPNTLKFVYLNRGAVENLGYDRAELLQMTPYQIIGSMTEQGFRELIEKLLRKEKDSLSFETLNMRKDGTDFPVEIFLQLVKKENEKGLFVAIVRDITERKRIDRMKNEFISTVSHELRTPLTSIRGSLGLMAGGVAGELPAQAKTLVNIAYNNSERLVRLINDILDIEKIESGKMAFSMRPQELMPLIQQTIDANRSYAEQHKVNFVIGDHIEDVMVNVDSDRLMQVLTNLLSNAAKFSPAEGDVTVSVTREQHKIKVSVADQGSGIPQEFRNRIFQKFAQADSSDSRQKGGTGLGLSITKAIVDKLGGEIGFESEENNGTTFYFELPEWHRIDALAANSSASVMRPRILICEDDKDIATLLGLMLAQSSIITDIAYDAQQAKKMLAQHHYAAMTLDLALPGQDGISLIKELRADSRFANLPVVVVSATADQGKEQLMGDAFSIVDWIDKPVDQNRLIGAISQAVGGLSNARPRILHVEDDPDISHIISAILQDTADVVRAATLKEAKRLLETQIFALVVLDLGMPDGFGTELLPLLNKQKPAPQVMIFSAQELRGEAMNNISAALVKSRTSNKELVTTITSLMERPFPKYKIW